MPYDPPNPRDNHFKPYSPPPSPVAVALAFLCAPALAGLGFYGYLQLTSQSVRLAPGGMPQLVAQSAPAPAPPAQAPAPRPQPVVQRPARNPAPAYNPPLAIAQRAPNGYFFFETGVNGVEIPMLFDTGATSIALRYEDAIKAGVDMGALNFSGRSQTANGTTEIALVVLGTVRVGGITHSDVPAVVMRRGKLPISLLGQSFTTKLAGFRFDGDRLVLQGR